LFDPSYDEFPEAPTPGNSVVQCVRGASETGLSDVATLLRTLLQIAERRVRITTAYFVPDGDLFASLCDAADRGVSIQILLPGPNSDKRFVQLAGEACYSQLLEKGAELWNYQTSMLHAKIMTVDGLLVSIGSANFNARSSRCDEEINLVVFDPGLTTTLDNQFENDLECSIQISAERWQHRSLVQRAAEAITAPVRRWF
jgi:cardiolipin synthase